MVAFENAWLHGWRGTDLWIAHSLMRTDKRHERVPGSTLRNGAGGGEETIIKTLEIEISGDAGGGGLMGNYAAYEEYKDSGVEWLGEIPVHWNVQRLKFNSYMKGRIGWQNLRSEEFIDEGPFLITGMHFKNGSVDWNSCYHISEERYQMAPEIFVQPEDLLVTKDGTIGKVAYVKTIPDKASINSHILLVRPKENDNYSSHYLYYLMGAEPFKHYAALNSTGTTFQGISQESMSNFSMSLPPLPEQQTIARFLDYKTAQIDALIAKKEALLARLAAKRTALISQAVTKGLDPTVPMKDSGVEWLGEIPAHWDVCHMKRLAQISYGVGGEIDRTLTEGTNLLSLPNVTKDGTLLIDDVPFCYLLDFCDRQAEKRVEE